VFNVAGALYTVQEA